MKISVISLTENGRKISEKISQSLSNNFECERYAFEKYTDENSVAFSSLRNLTAEIFHTTDAIIFICSCGIAVRMIAPHIVSKVTDPAVIAIDEQGKFAVSLLSGHLGGANALTEYLSEIMGATVVITTATDIGGKFSPDSFAKANNLHVCEIDTAKAIAAKIVNGERIGFCSDYEYLNFLNKFFDDNKTIGICISKDTQKNPFENTLHLVPKNIVLGVGCRRNIPSEDFFSFILDKLKKYDIPLWRVGEVHTIDIKKNERAILDFCSENKIPLKFYTAEQLMSIDGDFTHSDFVMQTTGSDNICERSAVADGGRIIVTKQAENGMTLAVAEKKIIVDFERNIL